MLTLEAVSRRNKARCHQCHQEWMTTTPELRMTRMTLSVLVKIWMAIKSSKGVCRRQNLGMSDAHRGFSSFHLELTLVDIINDICTALLMRTAILEKERTRPWPPRRRARFQRRCPRRPRRRKAQSPYNQIFLTSLWKDTMLIGAYALHLIFLIRRPRTPDSGPQTPAERKRNRARPSL